MIVFEVNHIWDVSNSKISQITTTTTILREILTCHLSCQRDIPYNSRFAASPGLYLPARNIGTSYVTCCWYHTFLFCHAHAWLQRLFKPHTKYGFHVTAILMSNRRAAPSGHYLPHVRPFVGKEQLTVRIFMTFCIRRLI